MEQRSPPRPAAALVVDGRVVAAAEEKRFSCREHGKRPLLCSAWELPELSAGWVLVEAGLAPQRGPRHATHLRQNGRLDDVLDHPVRQDVVQLLVCRVEVGPLFLFGHLLEAYGWFSLSVYLAWLSTCS